MGFERNMVPEGIYRCYVFLDVFERSRWIMDEMIQHGSVIYYLKIQFQLPATLSFFMYTEH